MPNVIFKRISKNRHVMFVIIDSKEGDERDSEYDKIEKDYFYRIFTFPNSLPFVKYLYEQSILQPNENEYQTILQTIIDQEENINYPLINFIIQHEDARNAIKRSDDLVTNFMLHAFHNNLQEFAHFLHIVRPNNNQILRVISNMIDQTLRNSRNNLVRERNFILRKLHIFLQMKDIRLALINENCPIPLKQELMRDI